MAAPARSLASQFRLLDWSAQSSRPVLLPDPPPLTPGESEAFKRLRSALDPAVASRVTSAAELMRTLAQKRRDEALPTMLMPLDALLGGGLPRGKVVEISSNRAAGRFSIAMASLAAATAVGEAAVLVDLGDHFDPQIAEANGVDLRRMLWLRPRTLKQAVMSAEMITATGFQLVIVDAGVHPLRGRRVPDAAWVRLGRAAEAHGAAMLVSTPYPLTGTASEAIVRTRTLHAKWIGRRPGPRVLAGTAIELTLEKHRHMRPGSRATLTFTAVEAAGARSSAPATPVEVAGSLMAAPTAAMKGAR